MKKTAFNIYGLVKTKEEGELLDSEIDLMLDSLFNNSKNFEDLLLKKVRQSTYNAIKPELEQFGTDHTSIKEFLSKIKYQLKKLKVLEISIAFEPTSKLSNDICSWIKENLGEEFVPDIKIDPTILGGAIIVFEGLYKDYTLKKTLQDTFEKKRNEIIKTLIASSN